MSVIKKLTVGTCNKGGRNNWGRITVFHRGGGHKQRYRYIDFKRNLYNIGAIVLRLERDPNRTANIALISYSNGLLSYIIAPVGLNVGDKVVTTPTGALNEDIYSRVGSLIPIKYGRPGEYLSNVELYKGKGAQLARSAGSYVQFVKKDVEKNQVILKLRSGEYRILDGNCLGMIGVISNIENRDKIIGKAGKSRWLGIRPTVWGVAMNPIDHPHGGGEGKTSGGGHPRTPWGQPTKGYKTRQNKRSEKFIIKRRK